MINEELSDFTRIILPALAIPVVITAWIIHTISNRIADCLYGGGDDGKK